MQAEIGDDAGDFAREQVARNEQGPDEQVARIERSGVWERLAMRPPARLPLRCIRLRLRGHDPRRRRLWTSQTNGTNP
jgi:hypothetical protein